ncbi:kynureninase [Sandarakinorhabdus sp. DWP1-3-1]|uniref:kynureninase n=1 Tax=Sandarakinorhabdus sp. DWP1-3-1 TaxID=2804627 RepID=UPI003CF07A8C
MTRNAAATDRAELAALDAKDPLGHARERFRLPPGVIYLDGNSLGPLPVATAGLVADAVERQWGEGLIRSWNDAGWIDLPQRIGAGIAPLLGTTPDCVIACDSVSVNLFKLAGAALAAQPGRRVIIAEADDFPTDSYILSGLARIAGAELRLVARDAITAALGPDVALLVLAHAHYATGAVHDMAATNAAAHGAGVLTLWDLSHSTGALALALDADGADYAVGCGYKYLNGGPGAPAFAWIARRHHDRLQAPLQGWMGHAKPFDFTQDYAPATGVARLAIGTPPILAMTALAAGVATFDGIDLGLAEAKSAALVHRFAILASGVAARFPALTVDPAASGRHGAQLVLRHPQGRRVMAALIARGIIGDFRPSDRLRFGFPALYTRFTDLWDAAEALTQVLAGDEWQDARFDALGVVS